MCYFNKKKIHGNCLLFGQIYQEAHVEVFCKRRDTNYTMDPKPEKFYPH